MTKPEEIELKVKNLIKELKKYDDMDYSRERKNELEIVRKKLVTIW